MKEKKKYDSITFRPNKITKKYLKYIENKSKFINTAIKGVVFLYNIMNDEKLFGLLRDYNESEKETIKYIEDGILDNKIKRKETDI